MSASPLPPQKKKLSCKKKNGKNWLFWSNFTLLYFQKCPISIQFFLSKIFRVSVNSELFFFFLPSLANAVLHPGLVSWPDISLYGQMLAHRCGLRSRCNLCLLYKQLPSVIKKKKKKERGDLSFPRQEVNTGCAHLHPMAGLENQLMCVSQNYNHIISWQLLIMQLQAQAGYDQIQADWISAFKLRSRLNQTANWEIKHSPPARSSAGFTIHLYVK